MSRVSRNPHVIWDVVDGQTILCDTDSAEFFELNPTGAAIWQACESSSVEELIKFLQAAYRDEAQERLCADVSGFVSSLKTAGLLVVCDESCLG
jgi:hypothetical protein